MPKPTSLRTTTGVPEAEPTRLTRAAGVPTADAFLDVVKRSRLVPSPRHDRDAGSFLERPLGAFVATSASGQFDTADDSSSDVSLGFLQPSDKSGCLGTLGQYGVVELVGRGGKGLVLRAHDPKLIRVVTIKVMAPELATNAMAVKRFLREAQAAAAVVHEHVVTIHTSNDGYCPGVASSSP
jgi:serine/threonine protein kinase